MERFRSGSEGEEGERGVLTRAVSRERVPLIDTVVPESFTWRRYEKFDEAC